MDLPIANRKAAGQALAEALRAYRDRDDVIVLGLPRGGVPVAMEVAVALNAPLDLMLVRKLGTPGQEELAMGAIASLITVLVIGIIIDGCLSQGADLAFFDFMNRSTQFLANKGLELIGDVRIFGHINVNLLILR